ncbi:DDE-type integrase/transposase/recombinase [Candidatus Azambacteria bacterium]|nr:DDE-type integrase/transposase/recombinase [Candidatus Azambacteria bacterium]
MAYTQNPYVPKVRRDAAYAVFRGESVRKVARRFGVSPGTISKWVKKAESYGFNPIPTLSSRPRHHPRELPRETVLAIVARRMAHGRTSEVIHAELARDGVIVSLNSVRRTIDRAGLMKKRSPWKRYHSPVARPAAEHPGDLVQIDTMHRMVSEKKRTYTFALIDTYSRWAYAKTYARMNGRTTLRFIREAERHAPFRFSMLQSDHGPEFSRWFVSRVSKSHRYSRIGKPNDNAHIERFNRTIQEECLDHATKNPEAMNRALKKYLPYYNGERLHLGIDLKAPEELAVKCFQGIG